MGRRRRDKEGGRSWDALSRHCPECDAVEVGACFVSVRHTSVSKLLLSSTSFASLIRWGNAELRLAAGARKMDRDVLWPKGGFVGCVAAA